jgi:creatinine amidohydrolase
MHLAHLKWPDVEALSKDTPVIVPIAALEQHGLHMPVFTDSLLTNELVRRLESHYGNQVLITPLMWLGNSHHHLDFPGTLSAEPRLYIDLLNNLLENLIAMGFKRLILFNGHGGNDVPGKQAVFETRQKHRERADLLLLFVTYWNLGAEPWVADTSIQQRVMGHACEWETSMVLRLDPTLVGDLSKVEPVAFGNPFEPALRGWIMNERSETGHVGDPRFATAEKGEVLFSNFTDSAVQLLDRVIAWDGVSWDS